ncbi:MAG: Maf-like protein [Phycisphaerae bacterium]
MSAATETQPIILASRSPRRALLLSEAGIEFEVVVPECEEPLPEDWLGSPCAYAESTSYLKARAVADAHFDRVILAADTVVAIRNRLFGKAADAEDARRILGELLGTTQSVITGVTIYAPATGKRLIRHAETFVTMRRMSEEELDAYIASGGWQGKAGAYGIQDAGDRFIEQTRGSFSNVVGLPMELTLGMLKDFGVEPRAGR